jgi:multicomponent Na+:H+ antiporter subunit D
VSPQWILLIPLVGAVAIAATGKKPNLREGVTLTCAALLLLAVGTLLGPVLEGARPHWDGPTLAPGLQIVFDVEPLGLIYAGIGALLWIPNSIYSIGYMRGHHELKQTRFYVCFALALFSVMGLAFAGNLLTTFVFYEVLTISTFPLVTHHGTPAAQRSGRIYLGFLFTTSMAFLLLGMIWTWVVTGGQMDYQPGSPLLSRPGVEVSSAVLAALLPLFVFGIGKAAIMPFQFWLPAAMVAPTPVSALLHAVAVVKAGVFLMLKVAVYVFGVDLIAHGTHASWLVYLAAFSIVAGSLVALNMDNLKARLAYSTVSQLSYITLGALLGTAAGIWGGGVHVAMHAFGKITLFFCAGAIYVATGKTRVSQLDGLGRKMPVTMAAFFLGALSIIGLPPLGGAWSKWYLGLATLQSEYPVLIGALLVSSLLNVAYLLPIPIRAFFMKPSEADAEEGIHEAPLPCLIALAITALGSLVLFFAPELPLELARLACP